MQTKILFSVFFFLLSVSPALAQSDSRITVAAENQLTIVANLAWETMETVAKHHVNPPVRNQMILDGIANLAAEKKRHLYDDVTNVSSREDFTKVLTKAFELAEIDANKEIDVVGIVNGFLRRVPGAPQLVTTYQAKINKQLAENRYVGVGIALRKINEFTLISVAFRGGPAHQAGVINGDQIVEVDGVSMKGKPIGDVVMALRGPKDSTVEMVVRQPNQDKRKYEMTRGVVPIASVKGIAEKGKTDWEFAIPDEKEIAYLEVTDITGSTAAELMTAARQIERGNFKGLVLDLRNCFRADVHHMRMVADTLISSDSLGSWTSADEKTTQLKLRKMSQLENIPLKLIVSPAQTNEVKFLVQALAQHRNASIMGQLNPTSPSIRGKITLPSGLGTVENLFIGTVKLTNSGSKGSMTGHASVNNVTDRFRTGDKKIDEMIRKAAKSFLNGQP